MASEEETSSRSTTESLYCCRKKNRAQRYLAGVARAPHRLEPVLQSSLSSSDTSLVDDGDGDVVSEAVEGKERATMFKRVPDSFSEAVYYIQ